ncbi:transmembrane protein 44 [Toxotes jaculatrix]|uniref:transmembrane protein 44 n=1 Tax=Toxotes jaculatrix TaxID=941984 RepID=UPI001B3B0A02|nr:transmembrane protein 44 [Toxotes jaculatrix]
MGERSLIADGQTGRSSSTLFSNLLTFCVDSVSTCFSHDADKLCVPVGLSSLSVLLFLLSCLVLLYQRFKCRGENPGETIIFLYCFLGNLCSTVGAILSRQLYIQILMGAFAAAMDAVNYLSCCFPVFLCWNSKTERRLRMMRKRRRQHLLAVCVLMVVAGGFLKSRVTQDPADRPLSGRRLLHVTLQQDNTEILGYTLGLISFVIACTSRLPAVCRAYRGQMLTQAHMFSGLLCSLAGALYAAAILLYDTQLVSLLRVMPWLLSAMCCVGLDFLTVVLHWCKRGTRQRTMRFSPDTEILLGSSGIPTEEKAVMKEHRKQKVNSSAETKMKSVQKMAEMGRYMDVSIHPARKICLKGVTLSKEEREEDQPLNRTVRVIRVDSFCFSDTSCDSSPVSSDLEVGRMDEVSVLTWDFEVANGQWREPREEQQEGDKFPIHMWPANPKPFNICTCPISGLPQETGFQVGVVREQANYGEEDRLGHRVPGSQVIAEIGEGMFLLHCTHCLAPARGLLL